MPTRLSGDGSDHGAGCDGGDDGDIMVDNGDGYPGCVERVLTMNRCARESRD
jgi:hypothetical protein